MQALPAMQPYIDIPVRTVPFDADVTLPGSKSYTNRALLIAAMAEGRSVLRQALFSDDTYYMCDALRRLGIAVHADEATGTFTVEGQGGSFPATQAELFVGNAGTAARFLTAYLGLGHGTFRLDGVPRMRQRPIQPLLAGLRDLGVDARSELGTGCPPVIVRADGLPGGRTRMPGDQSSQFFSALLLVGPCTDHGIEIEVLGDLVSKPYIDLTADSMRAFGATMQRDGFAFFRVSGRQRYRGRVYDVEPDASNASYFFAAAALVGGRIRVRHLTAASAQGDIRLLDVLEAMGARIVRGPDYVEVQGTGELGGIEVDMSDMSDVAQTLAAIAPFARAPVHIRNVAHMRYKETDRLAALATELQKLGAQVRELPDGLSIFPSKLHGGEVATYDDHRMAMSFALVGLRVPGVRILNPGCVAKTFPDFFERFLGLP
jgi:3-phosphoshikimate 1-carboxyvinyltransferase